jgi:hypothetical protein
MSNSVALNDVIEVRAYCNDQTQNGINVVHYHVTSIVGAPLSDQVLADHISTLYSGAYLPYLTGQCQYAGLTLQIVNPIAQPRVRSVVGAGPGAIVGDSLPPEITMKIGTRANVTGRHGRGRSFLPFWGEPQSDINGKPNAGAQAFGAAWAAIVYSPITTVVGGQTTVCTPIIWTKKFAPARNEVVSTTVPSVWTHMKRRSFSGKSDVLGPPL